MCSDADIKRKAEKYDQIETLMQNYTKELNNGHYVSAFYTLGAIRKIINQENL